MSQRSVVYKLEHHLKKIKIKRSQSRCLICSKKQTMYIHFFARVTVVLDGRFNKEERKTNKNNNNQIVEQRPFLHLKRAWRGWPVCGGEERSQGPKVWSADTRVAMHNSPHVLRTLFLFVPWYRHFSIVDTHVKLFHHPCFGIGHSRRFRRTSNQSMPVHP